MALKINLKGGDSLLIGSSRFTIQGDGYTSVLIEGDIPVMRESDAITEASCTTPLERLAYQAQQFYLTGDERHLAEFDSLSSQVGGLARDTVAEARNHLRSEKQFLALKLLRAAAGM